MYEGDDRVTQVNALRTLAADIAEGYSVPPEDMGNAGIADEFVDYYIEEADVMPGWFDEHDRELLVLFVEEALQ